MVYQQEQNIENPYQQPLDKQWFEFTSHRTTGILQSLSKDWLPYIYGQKIMSNLQSSSLLQNNEGEPPADNSYSVEQNPFRSAWNGNENEDNGLKTSSRKSIKAEKLAALEKDFSSTLRLKKMEFAMKRKILWLEM